MTLVSQSELVLFEREGGVATIAWNRPQTLNAISTEMLQETRRLIRALEEDPTFKALIITAVGRGFCSGMDVNDMKAREHEQVRSPFTWPRPRPDWQPVHLFRNASFPVIGAINGSRRRRRHEHRPGHRHPRPLRPSPARAAVHQARARARYGEAAT